MRRFLVHMHHSGYNCLFGLMLFQKMQGLFKKHTNLRRFFPLKNSGLAVNSVSIIRILSFRVRHPAAAICRSDSDRYLPGGLTRWKLYLLRLVSTSGLLAYFSFVRSLWASILPISGPLYFTNRLIAYCAFSMLNPSVSARQCHIPARRPIPRPPDTAGIPAAISRKDWIHCRSTHISCSWSTTSCMV